MRPTLLATLVCVGLAVAACTEGAPTMPRAPSRPLLAQSSCSLGVTDAEALALLDELLAAVNALASSGALSGGQANALRTHVVNVRKNIQQGDYCTARTQLVALRNQITNFVTDGVLTPEQAEGLLGGATDVSEGYPHFKSLSAGSFHTCGLTAEGVAYCWGLNFTGQLGDGTGTDRPNPVLVGPGLGLTFASISAGIYHTCAVTASGDAYCWGANNVGQLGDGTHTLRPIPGAVAPGAGLKFTSVLAGQDATCGAATNGVGYCWGDNHMGQLGNGTRDDTSLPTIVGSGLGLTFTAIDPGKWAFGAFACGVTTDQRAFCSGNNTVFGWLGDGGLAGSNWPVQVGPGMNLSFASVSTGASHACALTTSGAAYCWGANGAGQLGNGSADFPIGQPLDNTKVHRLPEAVVGGHTFTSISAGGVFIDLDLDHSYRSHTCGVTAGGVARCWGLNRYGELGDGTTTDRTAPTPVLAVSGGFASVTSGNVHSCGLSTFGRAYCWGYNGAGGLGDGTTTTRAFPRAVKFN